MVKYILIVFCTACLLSETLGQVPGRLSVTRTTGPITLDGELNEAAWREAPIWDDFVQCVPAIGAQPTETTTVRVLYDNNYLYVGIEARDATPSNIMATGLERDVYYSSDDNLSVVLDTYNDKRQAILLSTNPLSARFDEEVVDNGNIFNAAYNTFWNVVSSRDTMGYTSEFQIPFSSLRFEEAQQVVMGFKVIRYIKHRNEFDIFPASDARVSNAVWRINNSQEVVFTELKSKKPFYFTPYAKMTYKESKSWNGDMGLSKARNFMDRNQYSAHAAADKVLSNIGFDIKYGISKNFTLDATVNTDFAQAESDNRILNFTRFAVNLPEKRNFFLESRDFLSYSTGSGMLLFNSRAIGIDKGVIVPIIGGIRLSGKARGLQLGLLDLQTKGVPELPVDAQHFSVLRIRKEIGDNGSFVGAIFTNRVSTQGNDFNNQVVALDAVRRFRDNKWITALNVGASRDQAVNNFSDESLMANVLISRVATLGYNLTSSFEYVGRDFKARSGFAPDSAYVLANVSNGYIWKWRDQTRRNLFWLTHVVNWKYRTINSTNESIYTELEFGNSYQNGATILFTPVYAREYLPYAWHFANDIVIPSAEYSNPGLRIRFDSKQTQRLNYSVIAQLSNFYGGIRSNFILKGYYAIDKNFRVTYSYELNAFKFPLSYSSAGVQHYSSNLLSLGIGYTHSIYFSAKALVQYDDQSRTVGGNFRIRYSPKEGTDLFVVYNPRLNTAMPVSPTENRAMVDQQVFIVKFSKAISL